MKITYVTIPAVAGVLDRERLRSMGEYTEYTDEELKQGGPEKLLADTEILLCGTQWIKPGFLDACPNVKLVVMRATGYNTVDVEDLKRRGITVCYNPLYGTIPVAQHAIALMLALSNRIPELSRGVREGRWSEIRPQPLTTLPMVELYGKTFGVIGFGRIGRQAARMASGFGMRILACDPFPTEEGRALAEYVPLDRLLAESDVISLHCSYTAENHHLINAARIAQMKDGVMILNVARGPLIDEAALAEALRSGKVRGAGLDVLEKEPPEEDCPLLSAPNCLITPHNSWMAPESRKRMADYMIDTAQAWLDGKPVNVLVSPEQTQSQGTGQGSPAHHN